MEHSYELARMLAGIGLFLLGMAFLEESLRKLAGRAFKIFLKDQTANKFKAVAGGAIVTGVLQSSSVVNLMILALVGAGVLSMQNALAVILGTNIGTTLTSWIVALAGFKFNMEILAFPVVGIFGILLVLVRRDSRLYYWSKFLLGLGLLFVGLELIKSGFEQVATGFDFNVIKNYPAVVFVLAGFVISSLIQSSSATVAIALTALHNEAIALIGAMAMVLGSEVGTTVKLIIASLSGVAAKKRVATGNFIYNTIMIGIALLALHPIHYFLVDFMLLRDPLVSLVIFQSGINVAGVIIFFPFLHWFGRHLDRLFVENKENTMFIKAIPAQVGDDLALDAFAKETRRFIFLVINFMARSFNISPEEIKSQYDQALGEKSGSEKYDHLKMLYGEMHAYAIRLNKEHLDNEEKERLERLTSAVRNAMFAAKSIHDSAEDIEQFGGSSNNVKYEYYRQKRTEARAFYEQLVLQLLRPPPSNSFEAMVSLYHKVQHGYTSELGNLYKVGADTSLREVEITTLINFNRELYSSHKAIVWALKDFLLDKEQARYFAELPGFIR